MQQRTKREKGGGSTHTIYFTKLNYFVQKAFVRVARTCVSAAVTAACRMRANISQVDAGVSAGGGIPHWIRNMRLCMIAVASAGVGTAPTTTTGSGKPRTVRGGAGKARRDLESELRASPTFGTVFLLGADAGYFIVLGV